jgi:hypothetical protein
MTTNAKFPARLVAAAAAILILSACGSSTTAPDRARTLPTAASALQDDSPPIAPCRSGWVLMDGKWTCADPGI